MDLDEDDYEALGYGADKAYEALAKKGSYTSDARRRHMRAWFAEKYATDPAFRARHKEYVKRWQQNNKEHTAKWAKKYSQTSKGKAVRAKIGAKYYAANRTAILERRRLKRLEKKKGKQNE